MELVAAIAAVASMKTEAPLTVVSDSQYVVRGMNEWLPGWKKRNWRTARGQPIKNADLWKRLDTLVAARRHGVQFEWVKGHAGAPLNELADRIAHSEAQKAAGELDGA